MNKLILIKNNIKSGLGVAGHLSFLLVITMLVSACASNAVVSEKKGGPDEIVVDRAKARWTALLDKDLETAYSFYSPGFRSTTSVVDFMFMQRSRRVKWESAEYLGHTCTGSACKIQFKTGYKVQKAIPGMDVYQGFDEIEESWVKTKGEWWYVPPKG